jgi:mannose-6-phosphate isomerase-like protein (cupin superfamily)
MAHSGDVIENPCTGERIVFLRTAADTGGELLLMEYAGRPGLHGPPAHIHVEQQERFEVMEGAGGFRVAGQERILRADESAVVPPGAGHTFWNAGDRELRMRIELRPALDMETLFETNFRLGREGKTNERGRGGLLQDALLAHEYGVFLAFPPVPLQRPVIRLMASVARWRGLRARYDE